MCFDDLQFANLTVIDHSYRGLLRYQGPANLIAMALSWTYQVTNSKLAIRQQ